MKKNLQPTHYSLQTSSGFTLMELLLAMAIVAIMSGAILVSMSGQRKKANQSKLLAELSGVMQPMLMCKSDNNSIKSPNGGTGAGNICDGKPEYGKWPSIAGTDFVAGGGTYHAPNDAGMNDGVWYFYISDGSAMLCCNSVSSKCQTLKTTDICSDTAPAL